MANVQIHELDSFTGFPTETDYLAIDDGSRTFKIPASEFDSVINAYPRSGATALAVDWLSETAGGSALTPTTDRIYILMTSSGGYSANTMFRWSGTAYEPLTSGGSGGGGTSTPTADTTAMFDSTAHMNSTDMTAQEVTDFVDGLDGQGANLADYVVEQGTTGIWKYRKWNSGIMEAWGISSDAFAMTSALAAGLYYGLKTFDISALGLTALHSINVTGNCAALYVTTKVETVSTTSLTLTALGVASRTDTIKHSINIKGRWE